MAEVSPSLFQYFHIPVSSICKSACVDSQQYRSAVPGLPVSKLIILSLNASTERVQSFFKFMEMQLSAASP